MALRVAPFQRRLDRHLVRYNRGQEGGFTLVELLVVLTIMPLLVGVLSLAIVTTLSQQSKVVSRISGSSDLQVINGVFVRDVESSQSITTQATPWCGGGTQLLGLRWSQGLTTVSYAEVAGAPAPGGLSTNLLERSYCIGGSLSPSSVQVISPDVQPQQGTPTVCLGSVGSCSAPTSWPVATQDVAQVAFRVYVPQSQGPYVMIATPHRGQVQGLSGSPNLAAPVTLLSSSSDCSSPSLTIKNNGSLSIDVNGGSGNGVLAVASPCPGSVVLGNNAQLCASAILTGDSTSPPQPVQPPNGGSGKAACVSGVSYPGPADSFYATTFSFAQLLTSLRPPPTSGLSRGTCTPSSGGKIYTCTPGSYTAANLPTFPNNAVVIFRGGSTAAYTFATPLVFPNGASVTMDEATYAFTDLVSPSTNVLDASANNISLNASGALLYAQYGSIAFGNNATVSITPPADPAYDGVALWAAGSGVTVALANNSSGNTYGGVYVPHGAVMTTNNGSLSTSFIVANTATFSENTTITVTAP